MQQTTEVVALEPSARTPRVVICVPVDRDIPEMVVVVKVSPLVCNVKRVQ